MVYKETAAQWCCWWWRLRRGANCKGASRTDCRTYQRRTSDTPSKKLLNQSTPRTACLPGIRLACRASWMSLGMSQRTTLEDNRTRHTAEIALQHKPCSKAEDRRPLSFERVQLAQCARLKPLLSTTTGLGINRCGCSTKPPRVRGSIANRDSYVRGDTVHLAVKEPAGQVRACEDWRSGECCKPARRRVERNRFRND